MTELRVYLPIEDLQPQFAAYLSSPTRARGYPPFAGQHSLIIEVAPALAIHRITDLALKSAPALFACMAANEAEKAAPNATINDVQMMGATGRLFILGTLEDMQLARDTITVRLEEIKGR